MTLVQEDMMAFTTGQMNGNLTITSKMSNKISSCVARSIIDEKSVNGQFGPNYYDDDMRHVKKCENSCNHNL